MARCGRHAERADDRRTLLKTAAASLLAAPALARTATLRFVPQANLTALDPIFTTAIVTGNHAYYVFDTLYSCAADGVPKPQMAEGHEVSADGLTWRIRLREGLRFHDGSPVRGVDCVASIKRWTQRDAFGQLVAKVVERWGAPDDRTMELRLTRPPSRCCSRRLASPIHRCRSSCRSASLGPTGWRR